MNWLKKFFHKFFIDERGAVSIYLILVSLSMFLLSSVLIDFMRIKAAERQSERAIQSALRTSMANIDTAVFPFAIFGTSGDKLSIFTETVEKNLAPDSDEYFKFIDPRLEQVVDFSPLDHRTLADVEVFKHQIIDDMKYRAPIEITLEIIEGFSKLARGMEQASLYSKIANKLNKLAKDRQKSLDKLSSHLKAADDNLMFLEGRINRSASTFPEVNSLEDIIRHYPIYDEIMNPPEKDDEDEEESPYSMEDARAFERNAERLVNMLQNYAREAKKELEKGISDLDEARGINEDMAELIAEKEEELDESYGDAKDLYDNHGKSDEDGQGGLPDAEASIEEANNTLKDFVIEDSHFTELKQLMNEGIALIDHGNENSLLYWLNHFHDLVINLNSTYQAGLVNVKSKVVESLNNARAKVTSAKDYYKAIPNKYLEAEEDEEKQEAEDQLDNNKEELDENNEPATKHNESDLYNSLKDKVEHYEGHEASAPRDIPLDDVNKSNEESMNSIDMIFKGIGTVLKGGRNKLYFNEYVLTRFTSHNFHASPDEILKFENNEVEYIIYGMSNTTANYYAALSEIFALRFAVNFLEAFTQVEVRVAGPKILWAALAYALKETLFDLRDIKNGRAIDVFDRIPFKMDYKDHLRLFLLMHPEGSKVQRTMALIDYKSGGTDLTTLNTYVKGEIETSIDLWFLPGVLNMLSKTDLLPGDVRDGRFYFTKKAHFSY